jgi:phage terminase large subunit GpA-like protein
MKTSLDDKTRAELFDIFKRHRIKKVLPVSDWARRNRTYPTDSALPGRRDPTYTAYTLEPSEAAFSGDAKRIIGCFSAQSGKTESLCLDVIGAMLDQRPRPMAYVGPTLNFVTDIFEPRLMQMLDNSKTLRHKLVRGKRNKKAMKWINGSKLRLIHAGSTAALKSEALGLAFLDEADEMSRGVRDQGDVLALLEARGTTFQDYKTVIVSTPSRGSIPTEYDEKSGLHFWKKVDPDSVSSPCGSSGNRAPAPTGRFPVPIATAISSRGSLVCHGLTARPLRRRGALRSCCARNLTAAASSRRARRRA